jgi:hypothetical protein
MQQLEERNTYTPTDIPHIRSNCGLILKRTETSVHAVSTYGAAIRVCDVNWRNGLEETLSVSGLKTSLNNSDAALTGSEKFQNRTFEFLLQKLLNLPTTEHEPVIVKTGYHLLRRLLHTLKSVVSDTLASHGVL